LKEVIRNMPRADKVEAVKAIAADLKANDVYYFVDYRGLNYGESEELRLRLAKAEANMKVVKNTLTKLAAAEAGIEGLDELIDGPTAIVYCKGDPAKVAKVIQDFIKEHKKAAIRGGRLEHTSLGAAEVETLATLPSREQLIAQLVGTLASPLSGLATVLNGPIRGLVVVLGQAHEKADAA
jgi:large subunit ribosomal protein L10